MFFAYLGVAAAGYLLGSVPFGLVLTRLAGLGDIRKIGSGNIGATNVMRTGHKGLAVLTILLDAGKAGLFALIMRLMTHQLDLALLAGFCGVLGHIFPVWLHFKGGKGVASCLGVFLFLSPAVGVCSLLTWIAAFFGTHYSSAGAIAMFLLTPFYAGLGHLPQAQIILYILLSCLCLYRHKENIRRLIQGKESKIYLRKKE